LKMKRTPSIAVAFSALTCLALAGCEAKKSESPLSPSVAGPLAGVEITAPKMLEPAQGFKFKETQQPIKLLIENSSTTGVRPISYAFEVASDENFASKVYARSGVPPGEGGRTSVTVEKLDLGRGYFWRVRAEDGANSSTFAASTFEVLPRALLTPPRLQSPVGGATAPSKRPELIVGASDRNAAIGSLRYEFQISSNASFGAIVASGVRDEGGGTTGFTPDADLVSNTLYYWRARASDGDTTSSWAGAESFRTPSAAPAPTPGPGPTPGSGGSCASNNGDAIVSCVAAKYPSALAAGVSLSQRIANMEFLRDRVIEAGICGGLDLAWNLKRGVGPHSTDALAWRHNGIDDVVDIGSAYDDTSRPLTLQWSIVAGPPGYDRYPAFSCK
jgi:hypothetical protein